MMALSILEECLLAECQGQVLNGTWAKEDQWHPIPYHLIHSGPPPPVHRGAELAEGLFLQVDTNQEVGLTFQ